MKNLSEKIGYFETYATEQNIKEYEEACGTGNLFYAKLKELVEKQKAGEIITDKEYRALPTSGAANYWSAADGYYHVNFHYSFHNRFFNGSVDLLYKFMDFLSVIDFTLCQESEVINWLFAFKYWFETFKLHRPDMISKGEFIIQILEAVDPIKHNKIGSLLNIDRTIAPDVFDNAVKYFRIKESTYKQLMQEYSDMPSLRAKDVMAILDISRKTLSRYVAQGIVVIDSIINKQYRYNKESVFKLVMHDNL